MQNKKITYSVYLERETVKELMAIEKETSIGIQSWIRIALNKWIDEYRIKNPKPTQQQ